MHDIATNVNKVRQNIKQAADNFHRDSNRVMLLAVSKTQASTAIRAAYAAGQRHFGENYLQEAVAKITELTDLTIQWHFIGPLQSNKTRSVAENFAWIHSVERFKTARRLSEQRPSHLPPLNVCLQVNIDNEATKAGVAPSELVSLARKVLTLTNIRLRGLMAIPAATKNCLSAHKSFAALRTLLTQLQVEFPEQPHLDTLSMGMSRDMEAAIAEGATIVRVGRDIFGARK